MTTRQSPKITITQQYHPGGLEAEQNMVNKYLLWMYIRMKEQENQHVPGWSGFVSQTGVVPTKLTRIDYYPVINQPITDYKTVKECLRYAEEATK